MRQNCVELLCENFIGLFLWISFTLRKMIHCVAYIGAQANHLKDVGCISFYFQLILKFENSGRCTVKERTFLKI